mmetsp:Transcript_34361/g.55603  ORF Transcript_34361/g.55603 Transcript_34361/m.55603 type:complete len:80 (+) Transcript_34361:233-472(+)
MKLHVLSLHVHDAVNNCAVITYRDVSLNVGDEDRNRNSTPSNVLSRNVLVKPGYDENIPENEYDNNVPLLEKNPPMQKT